MIIYLFACKARQPHITPWNSGNNQPISCQHPVAESPSGACGYPLLSYESVWKCDFCANELRQRVPAVVNPAGWYEFNQGVNRWEHGRWIAQSLINDVHWCSEECMLAARQALQINRLDFVPVEVEKIEVRYFPPKSLWHALKLWWIT